MKFSLGKVSIVLLVLLVVLINHVAAAAGMEDAVTLDDSEEAHAIMGDEVSSEDTDGNTVNTEVLTSDHMTLEAFDRDSDDKAADIPTFDNESTDRRLFCPSSSPFLCTLNNQCCPRSKCCHNQCCPRRFDKFCTVNGICLNKSGLALCETGTGQRVAARLCKDGSCCKPKGKYSQCSVIKGRAICSSRTGVINCLGKPGRLCSRKKCCRLPKKCCGSGSCCL